MAEVEIAADITLDIAAEAGLDVGFEGGASASSSGAIDEILTDEGADGDLGDEIESGCGEKGLKGLKAGAKCTYQGKFTKQLISPTTDDDIIDGEIFGGEDADFDWFEEADTGTDEEPKGFLQKFVDGVNQGIEEAPTTAGKSFVENAVNGIVGLICAGIGGTIGWLIDDLTSKNNKNTKNNTTRRYFVQSTMYLESSLATSPSTPAATFKSVQRVFFDNNDPTYQSYLNAFIRCRINCKKDLIDQHLAWLSSLGATKIVFIKNAAYGIVDVISYKIKPQLRAFLQNTSGLRKFVLKTDKYELASLLSDKKQAYDLIINVITKNINNNYNSVLTNNLLPFESVRLKYSIDLFDTDKDGSIIETSSSSGSATATVSIDGFNTNWAMARGRARYLAMLAALQAQPKA